jgi:hypothetical protein
VPIQFSLTLKSSILPSISELILKCPAYSQFIFSVNLPKQLSYITTVSENSVSPLGATAISSCEGQYLYGISPLSSCPLPSSLTRLYINTKACLSMDLSTALLFEDKGDVCGCPAFWGVGGTVGPDGLQLPGK